MREREVFSNANVQFRPNIEPSELCKKLKKMQ